MENLQEHWREAQGRRHARREILALTRRQVDLEKGTILIDRVLGDSDLPKFDKILSTPISDMCISALKGLRASNSWVLPDQLVFRNANETALGDTWWLKRFPASMIRAGFAQEEMITVSASHLTSDVSWEKSLSFSSILLIHRFRTLGSVF